jgi:hypothetical protein
MIADVYSEQCLFNGSLLILECCQVYCIFLFLYAASLFGTLISQVNEIVASHASMSKELDAILEAYLAVQPRQGYENGTVSCRS